MQASHQRAREKGKDLFSEKALDSKRGLVFGYCNFRKNPVFLQNILGSKPDQQL